MKNNSPILRKRCPIADEREFWWTITILEAENPDFTEDFQAALIATIRSTADQPPRDLLSRMLLSLVSNDYLRMGKVSER